MIEAAIRKRTLFRKVNEPDCLLRIEIPGGVYDEIVADRERFLVAEGHEETAEALAAA